MALLPASLQRQLLHRRSIDVQVFSRGDGLWEVDALLTDVRPTDTPLGAGVRKAGDPIHQMLVRLVINAHLDILEAGAETQWAPYAGVCENHGDAYTKLVGLNLMQGFRHAVRQRLGGVLGCTHITELTQVLPTAVIQALAGSVIDTGGDAATDAPPFQLDRCHALRRNGPVVRSFYPRWFTGDGALHDDNAG